MQEAEALSKALTTRTAVARCTPDTMTDFEQWHAHPTSAISQVLRLRSTNGTMTPMSSATVHTTVDAAGGEDVRSADGFPWRLCTLKGAATII
jgi:hypothetical protein